VFTSLDQTNSAHRMFCLPVAMSSCNLITRKANWDLNLESIIQHRFLKFDVP